MTKHHSLDFQRFIECVEPAELERYFASLSSGSVPAGWATLNGDALDQFLALPANSELDGLIRQDFRRMNDLAEYGLGLLLDACARFSIEYDVDQRPQAIALKLFLDHQEAWDFAWSRYLLFALDSKVSHFFLPGDAPDFGNAQVEDFQSRVSSWLSQQAKGEQCEIRCFEMNGQQIIYIERGTYIRSITFWEDREVHIRCYRPVVEDVIAFDSRTRDLLVKATFEAEREDYVRLFAYSFSGDMGLGEQALKTRTFDLSPVAQNQFNYQGEGRILGVNLVGINLKLPFKKRATLYLNSPDIFETLKELSDISLETGELASARFRFKIAEGKRTRSVTFEVSPPARTDLPESMFTSLINNYLKKQGVRLR